MKRTGNLYEQIFFAEALSKDLEVFTPLGDYLPQDCLIMNKAGKVFKTQIKGTADKVRDSRGGLGRYMITCASGTSKKIRMDCTKIDVIAAYVAAIPTWYLIPCLAIDEALRISLYPHNPLSKAKHEKYREGWDIFKPSV
tara:strand:- start:123 stop:542 length:420 start_codon:yes stop_codon:yes gene_type:complete